MALCYFTIAYLYDKFSKALCDDRLQADPMYDFAQGYEG